MAVIGWFPQMTKPLRDNGISIEFDELINVELDDPRTPLTVVLNYPKAPLRLQQYISDPRFYCVSRDWGQDLSIPNVRELRVKWSTVVPDALLKGGKPDYDPNPLLRPIDTESSYYEANRERRMTYAKNAQYDQKKGPPAPTIPVVTTAGESLYLSLPEEVRCFNCTKNVPGLPAFMGKCGMFTNSDQVKFQGLSFQPLELLARGITLSKPKFEFGVVYYVMNYQLMVALDEDGWCEKRRNAGYHEKAVDKAASSVGFGVKHSSTLDAILIGKPENLHYPSSPVLLTPSGRAFRAPGKGQPLNTPQDLRTGPILSAEGSEVGGLSGITDAEFKAAELKFYPRMPIPFNRFIPLR